MTATAPAEPPLTADELERSPLYLLAVFHSAWMSGDRLLERRTRRRLEAMGVTLLPVAHLAPADDDDRTPLDTARRSNRKGGAR